MYTDLLGLRTTCIAVPRTLGYRGASGPLFADGWYLRDIEITNSISAGGMTKILELKVTWQAEVNVDCYCCDDAGPRYFWKRSRPGLRRHTEILASSHSQQYYANPFSGPFGISDPSAASLSEALGEAAAKYLGGMLISTAALSNLGDVGAKASLGRPDRITDGRWHDNPCD